jgi:hypothetical protein
VTVPSAGMCVLLTSGARVGPNGAPINTHGFIFTPLETILGSSLEQRALVEGLFTDVVDEAVRDRSDV